MHIHTETHADRERDLAWRTDRSGAACFLRTHLEKIDGQEQRLSSKCSRDILFPVRFKSAGNICTVSAAETDNIHLGMQRAPAHTGRAVRSTRRPNGASTPAWYDATVFPQAAACNWHFQHPEMTDERWRLAWKEYWEGGGGSRFEGREGDGKKSTVIER